MKRDARDLQETLSFEYQLDAPPAKVWRALTIPEYVARWLVAPDSEASAPERAAPESGSLRLLDCEPNRSVRYGWREDGSSFGETIVTFRLAANDVGGTTFSIVHELSAAPRERPANSNRPMLLAA
jgi:uncharacterized protein YndB with AHSA1/START domain